MQKRRLDPDLGNVTETLGPSFPFLNGKYRELRGYVQKYSRDRLELPGSLWLARTEIIGWVPPVTLNNDMPLVSVVRGGQLSTGCCSSLIRKENSGLL